MHSVKLNIRRDRVDEYVYGYPNGTVTYNNGTDATLRTAHNRAAVSTSYPVAEMDLEVSDGGRRVTIITTLESNDGVAGILELATVTSWKGGAAHTSTRVARVNRDGLLAPNVVREYTEEVSAPEPIIGEQENFTRRRLVSAACLATSLVVNLHADRISALVEDIESRQPAE